VAPSIQTLERLALALNVSEASLLGDQRAVLERFFAVLDERGVTVESAEQSAGLANAVADLIQTIDAGTEGSSVADPVEPMRRWLNSPADAGIN
jgi:transcriptional regulator with XRE-family HTH domain